MANHTQLLKLISDNIKANGKQEITGQLLGGILQVMVTELGEGSQFVGIATPDTRNPGTPDGNVFYIAIEPGTYSNFGVIVPNGSIGIIHNTSSDWEVTLISRKISQELGNSEDAVVSQKAITKLLQTKTDNTLQTTDKTVAGAINEVNQAVKNKQDKTDESLQTNNKTVTGAINEVNQVVKNKQDKTDESLQTTDKTVAGAINEVNQVVKNKQDKTDESLQTTDKTIAGAINELLSSGKVSGEVIAQALAELYAKVMSLGSVVDNMGHLRARRLALDNFPEICGAPMYSSGEGAPSVPPKVPFQEYYDITNKKFYKAQGELPDTPTTANWIAIN